MFNSFNFFVSLNVLNKMLENMKKKEKQQLEMQNGNDTMKVFRS